MTQAPKKWITHYDSPEVIPLDDLRDHVRGPACECRPFQESGVLVHHSFDQREYTDANELKKWAERRARIGQPS